MKVRCPEVDRSVERGEIRKKIEDNLILFGCGKCNKAWTLATGGYTCYPQDKNDCGLSQATNQILELIKRVETLSSMVEVEKVIVLMNIIKNKIVNAPNPKTRAVLEFTNAIAKYSAMKGKED